MRAEKIIIMSGVSGAGKSTALRALEDLGYFCIDNLPTPLINSFVDFLLNIPSGWELEGLSATPEAGSHGSPRLFGLLIDCRDEASVRSVLQGAKRLRESGVDVQILYFDCADEVASRRYQETRRPHPLLVLGKGGKTLGEALARERELLSDFRGAANHTIDTTGYSPHELRQVVTDFAGGQSDLEVTVMSFGFKFGVPSDVDLVVDVRFLPNPYFVPELRELTGVDERVSGYVFRGGEADEFLELYDRLVHFLVPRYRREGKRYLNVAVGCTGGRHRSVAVAERLAQRMGDLGVRLTLRHRDKEKR